MADSDLTIDVSASPAPHRDRVSMMLVLFGLIAAPGAWIVETTINYMVASRACYPHDVPLSVPITTASSPVLICLAFAALTVSIAGWLAAYQAWRHTRHEMTASAHGAAEEGEGRTRFLALAGMFISALFLVAALFDMPGLFLPPCA